MYVYQVNIANHPIIFRRTSYNCGVVFLSAANKAEARRKAVEHGYKPQDVFEIGVGTVRGVMPFNPKTPSKRPAGNYTLYN